MNKTTDTASELTLDEFDAARFKMDGFPHRRSTVTETIGDRLESRTYIIDTYRADGFGDTVLIERTGTNPLRVVFKPKVTDAIARHRDSLGKLLRSNRAKAAAQGRKAQGKKPGFKMTAEERADAAQARLARKAAR